MLVIFFMYLCLKFNLKNIIMKTDFTMKMAGTKYEAIKVILETLENNAVWLNKCESSLFALVYSMHVTKERERWLKLCTTQQIKDLYIEIRTQYYNATDIKF